MEAPLATFPNPAVYNALAGGVQGRLSPIRDAVDVLCGGVPGEVLFQYLDSSRPAYRTIQIPKDAAARIDVIDTWGMTVHEVPGIHTGIVRVDLPSRPFMALRISWEK